MIRQPPRPTLFPYPTLSDLNEAIANPASLEYIWSSINKAMNEAASKTIPHKKIPSDVQPKKKQDRKSTRLNSSHSQISYAVFCLKKKKKKKKKKKNRKKTNI